VLRIRRLIERAGHRGAFLSFLALLDILFGWSILGDAGNLTHVALFFPAQIWGIIWLTVGIFLTTGIFTRHDKVHFAVAASLKAAWATVYLNVFVVNHFPRAWVSIVIWAAFAAIVMVVSSWPDYRRYPPSSRDSERRE
jgi:hypothetical protein